MYALSITIYYFHSFFFFKQKTAYDMRISDWSSDVCSSDLAEECPADACPDTRTGGQRPQGQFPRSLGTYRHGDEQESDPECSYRQIGRASCRESVCQYV